MTNESGVRSILGYRTLPTTILIVLIYAAAFAAISYTSQVPPIPHKGSKKLKGFNLAQAKRDLEHIAARPHPYNSHANDAVREYIKDRILDIAWGKDYVHFEDDLKSNGSWASTNYGVYFEGTNLLVKIDGTDDDPHTQDPRLGLADGVLFSAHYDSVSTAPGATDDGMGVVTILQLMKYFAENRQHKTAVFNINNGEEDWLNGAHAFMQHPWSNLTTTFLNLEGAAAGGIPVLFRATSMKALQAYSDVPRKLRVRHPHGNVITADAFARGAIRSGTDYSVYTGIDRHGPGADGPLLKEGLDVAFYKGRSRYHTKWDAPAFTAGGEKSLWAMIDVARGVGVGLLNPEDPKVKSKPGVYLDLFKQTLVTFSLKSLLVFNIVFLVVGPIVIGLLIAVSIIFNAGKAPPPPLPPKQPPPHSTNSAAAGSSARPPARSFGSTDQATAGPSAFPSLQGLTFKGIVGTIWKQASFWVALTITGLLQWVLVWGYVAINPFTIHSHPYLVFLSFFSLAFLSIILVLSAAFPSTIIKNGTEVREKEKTTLLLHFHLFAWIALLVSTIFIGQAKVGSFYFVTVWYLGVWISCVLGMLQPILVPHKSDKKGKKRARSGSSSSSSGSSSSSSSDSEDERPRHERTPLLSRATSGNGASNGSAAAKKPQGEGGAIGWWIAQVLASVPLAVLLVGQVSVLMLDAMSQSLSDGNSPWGVYGLTALLATLLALPTAPFTPKLHRGLASLASLTFVVVTIYLLCAFPFSQADPLKVYFQQTISLDPRDVYINRLPSSNSSRNLVFANTDKRIMTELTGTPAYIKQVLPYLPSARDADVQCSPNPIRLGLSTCSWRSDSLAPSPGGIEPWSDGRVGGGSSWFKADVTRTGWASAKIAIQGRNTRNCRLYFDPVEHSGVKVIRYAIKGGAHGMQAGYPVDYKTGIKELRLWSRTWDREWEIDVDWETHEDLGLLTGRIACEWAEYQSAMVDNGSVQGDERQPKIPALEEALSFLPEWAAVTKVADGLVEASVPFSVV